MPRSKKDKKVSLTKLATKGFSGKQKTVLDLRTCVEQFTSIYVYTVVNMRNDKMKQVREQWLPSRFFYGKNKIIAIAFGRTPHTEFAKDLHRLSKFLKGPCGLLFTDCTNEDVMEWFENFAVDEYARSGFKVNTSINLNAGPLTQFPHSMEPYLREKLGLPTKLDKGVVTLMRDFEVCKPGDMLTPEQARILELFEYKLATFRFTLTAKWSKLDGFEALEHDGEDEEVQAEAEQDDDDDDDDDDMDSDN